MTCVGSQRHSKTEKKSVNIFGVFMLSIYISIHAVETFPFVCIKVQDVRRYTAQHRFHVNEYEQGTLAD
jgi:hypothetical protein